MPCATADMRHGLAIGRPFLSGHEHLKQIWSPYYERALKSVGLIPAFKVKG